MNFEVFRGLSRLVFAPITFDENGNEIWGKVQPLAGVQSIETALDESNEIVYFDNAPSIALTSEGDDKYTLSVAVPALCTRAMLEGKKWDDRKLAYLSTPTESRYYAIGFKAGLVGDNRVEEYYWIYKGKFTVGSMAHGTEDNGSTHNIMQYTFTSVYTKREWNGQPMKYLAINGDHPMAADFLNFVFTPENLSDTNVFGIDFDLNNISVSSQPLSGIGTRTGAAAGLVFRKRIGGRHEAQKESDFSFIGPWKGIHQRLRDVSTDELVAVSGTDEFATIMKDPTEAMKYNLFTYFPKFWASWTQEERDGRRHWLIKVASTPFPNAKPFGGKEVGDCYMQSGYKNTPERVPLTSTSLDAFNAGTTDNPDSKVEVEQWMDRMMYTMLFLVETGDLNSQRQARGISDLWWGPSANGNGALASPAVASRFVTVNKNEKLHAGMVVRIAPCASFWSGSAKFSGMIVDVDNTGANTILDFGEGASITADAGTDGVGMGPQPVYANEFYEMGDRSIGWYDNGGTEGANHAFVYGMADPWGNIYGWLNGVEFDVDRMYINGVAGKQIADERFNTGYPALWDFDDFHIWPETFTGNTNTNFGDYFYVNRDARTKRACLVGGYWYDGSDGGLFYCYWSDASSSSGVNFGARAVRKG